MSNRVASQAQQFEAQAAVVALQEAIDNIHNKTDAYVSPPVSPHLTEIETIELGGRTLKLGRNGKFYLVEQVGEGPFGEPHYAVFDVRRLIATDLENRLTILEDFSEELIQSLGNAIVERNGLAKKAGNQ